MYFEMYLWTSTKLFFEAWMTALYLRAALNKIGFYSGRS
jgi:type IV secretory pathway VirB6-like protein